MREKKDSFLIEKRFEKVKFSVMNYKIPSSFPLEEGVGGWGVSLLIKLDTVMLG